jgi:cell division protein FtsB
MYTWAQQPDLDQLKSRREQLEQLMQDLRNTSWRFSRRFVFATS